MTTKTNEGKYTKNTTENTEINKMTVGKKYKN